MRLMEVEKALFRYSHYSPLISKLLIGVLIKRSLIHKLGRMSEKIEAKTSKWRNYP